MSYRCLDSAKRATHTFGYALDYDAEIANDAAWIAFYSRPDIVAIAQWASTFVTSGRNNPSDVSGWRVWDVLATAPHLRELLGFSIDDARAICYLAEVDPNPFGEAQPGDYKRGSEAADRAACPVAGKHGSWWEFRCTTEPERLASLKKAKADLARHTRNKAKHG